MINLVHNYSMSNNKKLYEHQWMSVYETEDKFIYCERRGKDSIAILAYRLVDGEYQFLIRWQLLPATSVKEYKLMPCCITGSLWDHDNLLQAVKDELLEEGGIILEDTTRIKAQKSIISSTQMSEITHVYVVDVTGLEQHPIKGDGSYLESISKTEWVTHKQLIDLIDQWVTLVSLLIAYDLFKAL